MFKLASENQSFRWPVEFKFPNEKGKMEKARFYAFFRFKGNDELQSLKDVPNDIFFAEVIERFEELQDQDGNAIEGTKDDIQLLCKNNIITQALVQAYSEFNNGIERKNSNKR